MPKVRSKSSKVGHSDKKLGPMFGGCSEEEIRSRTLPQLIRPNLDLLFVGINPGLYSAYRGHYYSKKGNYFWPCLVQSNLVPPNFGPENDQDCLKLKTSIGFTDIVSRCTRAQSELTNEEFDEGVKTLRAKLLKYNPMVVVFNGKQIFARFVGRKMKDVQCGVQDYRLEGCFSVFYMMSNTSPLNAHYPSVQSRMFYYDEIKTLLARQRLSPYWPTESDTESCKTKRVSAVHVPVGLGAPSEDGDTRALTQRDDDVVTHIGSDLTGIS